MSGKPKRFGGKSHGKKDTRKYTQGKQGKTDEIRRALTHRARLRKNYFKLLKREGLEVPSKDDTHGEEQENEEIDHEDDDNVETESGKQENDNQPPSEIDIIKNKVKNHEALTFPERIALKKDRRERDKEMKMRKTKEKLDSMKKSQLKRQKQTERLQNTKTRKGQPLMGPRINDLLEKIKQNK